MMRILPPPGHIDLLFNSVHSRVLIRVRAEHGECIIKEEIE